MGEATAGVGHFTIPTSPAIGTTVAQNASANTYTAAYVQLSAAAPAAIFITGVYVQLSAGTNIPTYMSVQLATGAAASEVVVGQHNVSFGPTSGVAATAWGLYKPIYPPIPVANAVRIAAKTASSVASALSWAVTLECINQANVVDDGIAVATVTTVTNQLTAAAVASGVWKDAVAGDFTTAASVGKSVMNGVALGAGLTVASVSGAVGSVTGAVGSVTGLTASNLDATISSRMASYTQPTGFLAATFPAGTIANTTNITTASGISLAASQHVIVDSGTVTTLTNLPAITAGWLTATGIAASALNGKGDWNIGKTGYSLTQTFPTNFASMAISAGGLASADIKSVNGTTISGAGTAGSSWGP